MSINSDSNAQISAAQENAVLPMVQNIPDERVYTYPHNLNNALMLIQQIVSEEENENRYFDWLISHAPSEEDKQILAGIQNNKIRHRYILRKIYYELTGRTVPESQDKPFTPPAYYYEGIKHMLTIGQDIVQSYPKILFALQSRVHINMLTQLLTDELYHGIQLNFILITI